MPIITDTFLGADTPHGFVSLFDELHDPYREQRLFIIKGGPGSGKSTFMRRIAADAVSRGLSVERVHCASDPDSLDGLLIPALSASFCDGTAPHVVEPKFPGVTETLVDLGRFWNTRRLFQNGDAVRALTLECAIYHRRCTRFLQAAGALQEDVRRAVADDVDEEKLFGYALRFCQRELPRQHGAAPGRRLTRYLSGITPQGNLFFGDTVAALANRVIAVEDETGVVAGKLIEQIGERALAVGYDAVFCRCPMQPNGDSEHLILPQASLALVTKKRLHAYDISADRTVHARRFFKNDVLTQKKTRLSFDKRLMQSLLEESILQKKKAKTAHDKLERLYMDAMDFDALQAFSDAFRIRLFESPLYPAASVNAL